MSRTHRESRFDTRRQIINHKKLKTKPIILCRGKHQYRDKQEAVAMLNSIFIIRGDVCRAYPCPECGQWHLTSVNVEKGYGRGVTY